MAVSELPGNPNAVWTVKRKSDGEFNFDFFVQDSTQKFFLIDISYNMNVLKLCFF